MFLEHFAQKPYLKVTFKYFKISFKKEEIKTDRKCMRNALHN